MPTDHSLTVGGLLQKGRYRNLETTKNDVVNVLHHYRGLQPKMEKFTFNDGTSRELVLLDGTIPVPYRNASYNIPVSIFLLDTHPTHAPMVFVRPTQDMTIKVSRHVDHTGKVYLPYLHEWNQAGSDLLGLVQICIVIFSEGPPVYAKPRGQPAAPQPMQPPPPPYPPQPTSMGGSGLAYPPTAQTPQYPPFQQQSGPSNSIPAGGPIMPPVYPPVAAASVPNGPGYPSVYPSQPLGPPGPPSYIPPYPPVSSGATAAYPPQPQPPQQNLFQTQLSEANSGTIKEEHIKASLLSAVEDKVRRSLREEFEAKRAEMESLRQINEKLVAGQEQLKSASAALEREEASLTSDLALLTDKKSELDRMCEEMESSADVDPDEAVAASAPLHRQLFHAFTKEAAIEDAIYYLGEALRRQVITAEVFLKHVRNLSREQFLQRATMQKCRQKAGLPV